MRALASIGAALAALLAGATAFASPDPEPYVGLMVEELYDSDVMNTRGPDAVTRVSPRAGVRYESERTLLTSEYRLGLHAYAFGSAENTVNHRAALGGHFDATRRLRLTFGGVWLIADDPVLLDRPGVAIAEESFSDLTASLRGDYELDERVGVFGVYGLRRSRFEIAQDGDEHRLDAGVAWRWTRRLTVHTAGRAQAFVSYLDDPMTMTTGSDVGWATGAVAGVNWRWTRRTRVRAEAGPIFFVDSGPSWTALADVVRLSRRTRLSLAAVRDVYGGTGLAQALWAESVRASLGWRLGRQSAVRAQVAGFRNGVAPSGDADVYGVVGRAEIGWTFADRTLRLDLFGEHRAQDSDFMLGDTQRTLVGLRLSAALGVDILDMGEVP